MSAMVLGRRALLAAALGVPVSIVADVAPAAAATGPAAPIQQLDEALLTVMKQGRATPFAQRVSELTPAIENALDLPAILRLSVGPSWSGLSATEQTRLLDVFRQYTVASYVDNFNSYDGQTFTIGAQIRTLADGARVVQSVITPRSGTDKHTIDYVMRRAASGAWKASDVLADGTISRVAVLRSDFAAMLARGGAPALEASLQKKTAALQSS